MRCGDFDDLVLLADPALLDECCGGQMLSLSILLGQRVVRDLAHQVLEEAVLPALGRARVGLERQHLLAQECREERLDLVLR